VEEDVKEVTVSLAPFAFHDPVPPILPPHPALAEAIHRGERVRRGGLFEERDAARAKQTLSFAMKNVVAEAGASALSSLLASCASEGTAPAAAAADIRAEILSFLSDMLAGDDLAAEYLLLHTLSRVVSRGAVSTLGKLTLSLAGFPTSKATLNAQTVAKRMGRNGKEEEVMKLSPVLPLENGASAAGIRLHSALSLLLPRSCLLPLRVDNLNTLRFFPTKDPETNLVRAGLLQLTPGTYLVVDETVLGDAKLVSYGSMLCVGMDDDRSLRLIVA
jgi:hypothetical protein